MPNKCLQQSNAIFVVTLLCLIATLTGCRFSRTGSHQLMSIKLAVNYPIVKLENGELTNIRDTIPIYFYKGHYLHKIPYQVVFEIDDSIVSQQKAYQDFFFKKGELHGYLFDSLTSKRLAVDSFLFQRSYAMKIGPNKNSPIERRESTDNTILEKYASPEPCGETCVDSVYYYYNRNLKNINYSLSPTLDSMNNSKLFKIRLLYNEKISEKHGITAPKREFSFEIIRIREPEPKKIMDLFESYIQKMKQQEG